FPVLPNTNWIEASFTAVISVTIVYMLASRSAPNPGDRLARSDYARLFLGFIFVMLVWLGNGMLGYQAVVVTSGSMRPGIDVGDLAIVKTRDYSYSKGTVILFELNGGYVLHRVHDISNVNGSTVIHTKGDNNDDVDPWTVSPGMIVGDMVFKVPKIGWLTIWIKQVVNG
ncbi:MAG: signal peptidase I, partial [Desulfurococcales archaeon]|nr:signal peptidase I [Desulfurococcales archaeon]